MSEEKKVKRKRTRKAKTLGAVIYVGHVPRGFVEVGLTKFFSQFGSVKKVKLARSKKTSNPKGYAFVEFESDEVAEIAADTMNGYLMCGRVLKCNVVKDPSPALFKGYKHPYQRKPRRAMSIARFNRPKTPEQHSAQVKRLLTRTRRKRELLEKLGIDYTIPDVIVQKSKHTEFPE